MKYLFFVNLQSPQFSTLQISNFPGNNHKIVGIDLFRSTTLSRHSPLPGWLAAPLNPRTRDAAMLQSCHPAEKCTCATLGPRQHPFCQRHCTFCSASPPRLSTAAICVFFRQKMRRRQGSRMGTSRSGRMKWRPSGEMEPQPRQWVDQSKKPSVEDEASIKCQTIMTNRKNLKCIITFPPVSGVCASASGWGWGWVPQARSPYSPVPSEVRKTEFHFARLHVFGSNFFKL